MIIRSIMYTYILHSYRDDFIELTVSDLIVLLIIISFAELHRSQKNGSTLAIKKELTRPQPVRSRCTYVSAYLELLYPQIS